MHFQHSAVLVDKLTRANVHNYRVQFYSDNNHAIRYHDANSNLYYLLTEYLWESFGGREYMHVRAETHGRFAGPLQDHWYILPVQRLTLIPHFNKALILFDKRDRFICFLSNKHCLKEGEQNHRYGRLLQNRSLLLESFSLPYNPPRSLCGDRWGNGSPEGKQIKEKIVWDAT